MDFSAYVYDEEIRPIDKIEFSIWGNNEIKKYSVLGEDSIGIDVLGLYSGMNLKGGKLSNKRLKTNSHINSITKNTCS